MLSSTSDERPVAAELDLSRARPAPERIDEIETPAVLIDLGRVERNLRGWQDFCDAHGLANRPHVKTHKLVPFAKRQLELGARGITCQKLGEAEVMADAGIRDILLTYNILGRPKLERLAALARRAAVTVVADSDIVVEGLSAAMAAAGTAIDVLVECDTGGGRCGVTAPAEAARLAAVIAGSPGLRFAGLMTYPAAGMRVQAAAFLDEAKSRCAARGLAAATVSTGGSPDLWSEDGLAPITEYRAGTYIYNDRALVSRGVAALDDCATTVLSTVVSCPTPERAVIDAGSKALSSDLQGLQGFGAVLGHPDISIRKLNEEHGTLDLGRAPGSLRIGDRLRVLPNHVCVVSNLFDAVYFTHGDRVLCAHPVDARGRVT